MSSDSGDDLVSAYFADAVRAGDTSAVAGVAEVNEQTARLLVRVYNALDYGGYEDPAEHEYFQRILRRNSSLEANRAVQDQDVTKMSAIKGVSKGDVLDIADWKQVEILKDLFRQEPQFEKEFTNSILQLVLFSSAVPPTGRGKSNSMYSLVEIAQTVYDDLRVLSNNTSDPFETVPKQWADIEETVREHDGWMLLCIDEAAQFLQYADQAGGKTVSQCLKLLRHNRCHVVLVAHTGADVPKDIRRQVFFLDKRTQKRGVLGYGLKNRKGKETKQVAEDLYTITSIPQTDIGYDDIDDEGIKIEFDDEGDGEEYYECLAETKNGDDCPNQAKHPTDDPLVCVNHRNKLEEVQEQYDIQAD